VQVPLFRRGLARLGKTPQRSELCRDGFLLALGRETKRHADPRRDRAISLQATVETAAGKSTSKSNCLLHRGIGQFSEAADGA
jgi:hypothetical protein